MDEIYIALRTPIDDHPENDQYRFTGISKEQQEDLIGSAGVPLYKFDHIRDGVFAQVIQKLDSDEAVEVFFGQFYVKTAPEDILVIAAMAGVATVFVWSEKTWFVMSRLINRVPTLDKYLR